MSVGLDSMVSHSEESMERSEAVSPPGSPPRRSFGRCESAESSSSTDSSGSSGSGPLTPPPSPPRDSRLNMTSALHRLLTFPVGFDRKLNLNLAALAAVGFFWSEERIKCFKCCHEDFVIGWQGLNERQIQLKHYECTHPSEDDIPDTRGATCLSYEAHRLLTFYQNKGWDCPYVQPSDLAKNGFYYTGINDVCKCHFCKLEMSSWEAGDTPVGEHKKWSPQCPFLAGKPVGNFEIGKEIVERRREPTGVEIRPFARAENDTRRRALPDVVPRSATRGETSSSHPSMKTMEARLATFETWPADKSPTAEDLAEAGFYYSGVGDSCVCFHCGGGLTDWLAGDEPWVMHAKWFGNCKFLEEKQGLSFIVAVSRVHKPTLTSKQFKEALINTEESIRQQMNGLGMDSQPVC